MKSTHLTFATVLLAILAGTAYPQDAVDLKYVQLKCGEVLRFRSINDSAGTIEGMGPAVQRMTQRFEQWTKIECLKVSPDDIATIRMTFERIAQSMRIGPIVVSYDSAVVPSPEAMKNPALAQITRMFKPMIGASVTARLNPQGKCIEVTGVDEIFEQLPADTSDAKQIKELLASIWSDDVFKEGLTSWVEWVPNKKVRIGDVWSHVRRARLGGYGEQTVKSKYKLLGLETYKGRKCAKIASTLNMEIGPGDTGEGLKVPGGRMQLKMTGQGGTGLYRWDCKTGRLMFSQTSMPVEIQVQMTHATQPTRSRTITNKVTLTEIVEVLDEPPAISPKAATEAGK